MIKDILNKLFGKKQSEVSTEVTQEVTVSDQVSKILWKKDFDIDSTGLHTAMRSILDAMGKGFLCEKAFVNMLIDYQMFKDKPYLKNILQGMQSSGTTQKILSIKNWDLESKNIADGRNGIYKLILYSISGETVPCLYKGSL